MNFKFAMQINGDLERLDFATALQTAETQLKKLPTTPFHDVLGKSLVDGAEDLAAWVDKFYRKSLEKIDVKALYFEMNEFDINTDLWYIDCFAFQQDGGLDPDDMEWLCDPGTISQFETGSVFAIRGYESLQKAFETIEPDSENLQNVRDWAEQIIIARFMELMRAAHLKAKQNGLQWATVPVYFTEHSYDFVVRSEN